MATVASNLPSGERETFGSDIAGMFSFFFDPQGAARRLDRKFFWVLPIVVVSVLTGLYTFVSGPMVIHFMETAPAPANVSPEQYAQQIRFTGILYKFLPLITPIMVVVFDLIMAGLLVATSSMLAVRVRFLQLLNLVAGCGIISSLQMIAWVIILKAKNDISSLADLKPPLGLDIILPAGTNKFLLAVLGYFSIFQIWWIVMAILIYSVGFRTTKGKAAGAILPVVAVSLLFVLVGAIFQKT
jgi:hypothetical protein